MKTIAGAAVLYTLAVCASGGCGGSSGASDAKASGGSGGGCGADCISSNPGDCRAVKSQPPVSWSGKGTFWGDNLASPLDVDLGGGGYHRLSIRFRGEPEPGTYSLGTGVNATFAECEQCVMVMENVWGDNVNTLNFAASGRIVLERVNAARGEFAGRVEGVTLAPLLYDQGQHHQWGAFDPAATEDCLYVAEASFDTFAGLGDTCESSGDCVNRQTQVCDPATGQCVESQCDAESGEGCPADEHCLEQSAAYATGACYPTCEPFASGSCGPGLDCTSIDYWGARGVCKRQGTTALGEKCEPSTAETGCVPGAVCQTWSPFWGDSVECYATCDYFGGGDCDAGSCVLKLYRKKDLEQYCYAGRCHLGGTCKEVELDPAEIGEACQEAEHWCGASGGVARGFCDAESGNVCRQVCRLGGSDCATGVCSQLVANEGTEIEDVGVCLP